MECIEISPHQVLDVKKDGQHKREDVPVKGGGGAIDLQLRMVTD